MPNLFRSTCAGLTCAASLFFALAASAQTFPPLTGVTEVSVGTEHACAMVSGVARCWGSNGSTQLGYDYIRVAASNFPLIVPGALSDVVQIAVGGWHTCSRSGAGEVACWGTNSSGQLGNWTSNGDFATPQAVNLPLPAAELVAGAAHSCARLTDGSVYCWGRWAAFEDRLPTQITGFPAPVTALSAGGSGDSATCAIDTHGAVFCWGSSSSGANAFGGSGIANGVRIPVNGLSSGAVQVAVGRYHSCALRANGSVRCWGSDLASQRGNGTNRYTAAPNDVSVVGSNVTSVAAGLAHTCVSLQTGAVKCWGNHTYNELSSAFVGTLSAAAVNVDLAGEVAVRVVASNVQTCAVLQSGKLKCWGTNPIAGSRTPPGSSGRLGNGSGAAVLDPQYVVAGAASFSGGGVQTLTVLEDAPTTTLALSAAHPTNAALSWSIVASPQHGNVSLGNASSNSVAVQYTPTADYFGSDTIVVRATDPALATADVVVNITVLPVNDRPSFFGDSSPLRFLPSAGSVSIPHWKYFLPGGARNYEFAQAPTYTVSVVTGADIFTVPPAVAPNGALTFVLSGARGVATFDLVVKDDGGTANGGVDTSFPQRFALIAANACSLDFDGNGQTSAASDGVLLLRYLFGFNGDALTSGALGVGPLQRGDAAAVAWYIKSLVDSKILDVDGDGSVNALTDGVLILRAMLGLSGQAATAGAIAVNGKRRDWAAVQTYLNGVCGTHF